MTATENAREDAARFQQVHHRIHQQVARMMVGQGEVIDGVLTALLAGGHVLLEGVHGLGKTLLVRSLGEAVDVKFSRIQFTPDRVPADIQGTSILMEREGGGQKMRFRERPFVANLVLADEINRATPKTQSALLEAMQEKQITVGKRTIRLEEPGAQSLLLAAKVRALFDGRFALSGDDVRDVALPALRHRLLLNFHGQSEGITADQILTGVLEGVAQANALIETH